MITRCFTFGFGHAFPSGYVTVTRATALECREVVMEHFGKKWAFEYSPEQIADQLQRFPQMYEVPFPPGKAAQSRAHAGDGHWWGGNPHAVEGPGHFPEDGE